jgi:hypothetical protein
VVQLGEPSHQLCALDLAQAELGPVRLVVRHCGCDEVAGSALRASGPTCGVIDGIAGGGGGARQASSDIDPG